MRTPPPRSLRLPAVGVGTIVVIVLLVVTGLADVALPPVGVAIKKLSANLTFGHAPQRPGAPSLFDDSLFPLEDFATDTDDTPNAFRPVEGSPAVACPTASDTDFPEKPAGFDVEGTVTPGVYTWKQEGTASITVPPLSLKLSGFTNRHIENVSVATDGSIRYDFVIPSIFGRETDTIQVVPGSAISLAKVVLQARDTSITFEPLAPVPLITLPVQVGAPVGGTVVAVDPRSQRTMTLSGTVKERRRVDACGTVYEGWYVQATRTIESVTSTVDNGAPDDTSTTYDYIIAPQLAGMIIEQHRVSTGRIGPLTYQTDTDENIGTMSPRPLPPGER